MANPLLPRTTSIRHASILAGRSVRAFTENLFPAVAADDGSAVDTEKLEQELGFELTPAEWMAADRKLDQRRARQAAYQRDAARETS